MSFGSLRTRFGLTKILLKHKAKEQREKLKKALPQSGEDFGKRLEHKLSSSSKIWGNLGITAFSEKATENVSHYAGYFLGTIMLMLTDIIVIFPTEKKALDIGLLATNFLIVMAGLLIVNAITYASMRAIGSKTTFKAFYSTVNTALFMSILVVSIPLALLTFALFSTMLKSEEAINLFFSIIPFYNYLIYGCTSEFLAGMKGMKSVVIALISLVLILFFRILLPLIMV